MTYLPDRRHLTERIESIIGSLLNVLLEDLISGAKKEYAVRRVPLPELLFLNIPHLPNHGRLVPGLAP